MRIGPSRIIVPIAIVTAGLLASAQSPPVPIRPGEPDRARIPAGTGWVCAHMPVPSERSVCARDLRGCEALLAEFPWGGLPPRCVPHAGPAACITWSGTSAAPGGFRCWETVPSCALGRAAFTASAPSGCGTVH
jgi:hypothetical protein